LLDRRLGNREDDMTKAKLIATLLTLCAVPAFAAAGPKPETGRATIRGVDYYYEVHGKGEPLLLLHGGLLSSDSFAPAMPTFTKGRQVIVVDLQGHGRTTLGSRPVRCETIADDIDTLLKQIGRTQVDALGYSFGGCVALRLAVQHPERIRRLVLASTVYADDGWYAEMRVQQKQVSAAMAPMMAETPIYKTYKAVAPKPDDFPRLLDGMGDFMRQKYDWSSDVPKLKMPVLLVFGDADMIRPEHQVKFYQLLGGGLKDAGWNRESMPKNRLAVLPDMTHYEAFASARVAETALPFLNGQMGGDQGAAEQAKAKVSKK
jgi:pimeloyl-ACP methyl ester carboxylesterase